MLNSPARTRSWWGVTVSLLATIALAVAMVSVPTPAQAQAQVAGSTLRYSSDLGEQGGDVKLGLPGSTGALSQATTLNWFTGTSGGETVGFWVYCVEGRVGPSNLDGGVWEGTVSDLSLIHISEPTRRS